MLPLRVFLFASLSLCVATTLSAQQALPFPTAGLLPKAETGVPRFLQRHPEFDGRGVTVAIFDTGVDPGAEGLQTTSNGLPKIVDLVDATGSGDVDMATVQKAAAGTLTGLTGKKLKLPDLLKNPSGDFRLGVKRGWEIFNGELEGRLKKVRREAWDLGQRKAELDVKQKIKEWDAAHPSPTPADRLARADLDVRLEVLKTLEAQYDDPGPLYDCVVFNDGQVWRALIDTDEDGDLTDEKPLTDFARERGWSTFGSEDRQNFGVNIYDDGKRLSIVTDSGAHATHVAGIVSANYPQQPELNGMAPGAQIVSVKIGDSRLGSMETGMALLRALQVVLRNKCDLINMSYGEPTSRPDRGLISQSFADLVQKQGVIFVSSAGNAGPSLTTLGAPGGTTSWLFSVGAYLSPEMMAAQYSQRQPVPEMPYPFTSRGPTRDGDLGVTICAPGGAVAPVPQWTLRRNMQMNGTSMASPNACGGLALLLSGLKAMKTPYTPASVRRAIQNSARPVEQAEVLAQGPGLLQVDRAWDYLQQYAHQPAEQLAFEVRVSTNILAAGTQRGVYLREPHETVKPRSVAVTVKPVWPKTTEHQAELQFDLHVALKSTQPWVDVGPAVQLNSGGRSFEVRIDPTALPPGIHYAEVQGSISAERGPLFRVPVTVVRSSPLQAAADGGTSLNTFREKIPFAPGRVVHRFVSVPLQATRAELVLRKTQPGNETTMLTVDLTDAPEHQRPATHAVFAPLGAVPHRDTFSVTGGRNLEICLHRSWRSVSGWSAQKQEAVEVDCEVTFFGLSSDQSEVPLAAAGSATPVRLSAALRAEELAPTASLTTHRQLLRPTSAVVQQLFAARDQLPDDKPLYELILTYAFEQPQTGKVTPHFPLIDGLLYESEFGTVLWNVFDSAKRRVGTDEISPDELSLKTGSHLLKLQIRHTDSAQLDKLKDLWLALDRPIGPIALTVASSRATAPAGGVGLDRSRLDQGSARTVFVNAPASLPATAGGDLLTGTIRWNSTDRDSAVVLAVPPGKPAGAASPVDVGRMSELDIRMQQLKALKSEAETPAFDKLAEQILKDHPDHLPVLLARLHRLDDDVDKREDRLPAIIAAADSVLAKIHSAKLAAQFGTNVNPEDPAAVAERQKAQTQKEILIDTLYRKGRALGYMDLPEVIVKHPVADPAALEKTFEANFAELRKWVDTTDPKYFLLHIRRERRQQRYGNALRLLLKHESEAPTLFHTEKRRDLSELLGWIHQYEHERRWFVIKFPKDYEPF